MPIYAMKCDSCGHEQDIYRTVARMDEDLPVCCGVTMHRVICAPFVQPDLSAYKAIAVDQRSGQAPVIEGRKQHREFLKANGYVEVGNEAPVKRQELVGDFNVRKELTQATREELAKRR